MQKYEQICYDVLQYLDHSPTGRVLESFAPARGDMHSPRATGRALSIHPDTVLYIGATVVPTLHTRTAKLIQS